MQKIVVFANLFSFFAQWIILRIVNILQISSFIYISIYFDKVGREINRCIDIFHRSKRYKRNLNSIVMCRRYREELQSHHHGCGQQWSGGLLLCGHQQRRWVRLVSPCHVVSPFCESILSTGVNPFLPDWIPEHKSETHWEPLRPTEFNWDSF